MQTIRQEDISISTCAVHNDERIDFWIDTVGRMLVQLECSRSPLDGIEATMTRRDFGLFNACDISANRHAIVRSPHNIRMDQRDAVFVCLMKEGDGYTFQGVDCMLHGPGDVVIYDTASPYGHGFPDSMAMIVLDIPRRIFESCVGTWHYRDLVKIDHADRVTGWALQQIHKLLDTSSDQSSHDREQSASRILDLLQSTLRINGSNQPASRSAIHTLQRAKAFIEEHLGDDELDCDSVSRAMKMSARQLARIFEIEGVSITRLIWSRRLDRCRADLRNPSLKYLTITEIAFRWGFNNSAHFSRSYRARFKEAPTQTRAGASGSGSVIST